MRPGGEFFTSPTHATQRRYEALRAYLVQGEPAAAVAQRFGYTAASERSVVNSVVYHDAAGLARAYHELEAAYEEAWTVWVPDHDEEAVFADWSMTRVHRVPGRGARRHADGWKHMPVVKGFLGS